MEELTNLVAQKTGIPADKARMAVQAVLEYVKGRLPGPIAAQIDGAINSTGASAGLGDIAKGVSDLFGKK